MNLSKYQTKINILVKKPLPPPKPQGRPPFQSKSQSKPQPKAQPKAQSKPQEIDYDPLSSFKGVPNKPVTGRAPPIIDYNPMAINPNVPSPYRNRPMQNPVYQKRDPSGNNLLNFLDKKPNYPQPGYEPGYRNNVQRYPQVKLINQNNF